MIEPELQPETVPSFDGTVIAARRLGGGPGTPLLLVDAIGTKMAAFKAVAAKEAARRPVINWDLRGFFDSGPPGRGRMDAHAHAKDALAVLDHFDAETCVIAAWSSGGRIALELAAGDPGRVEGLILICSGYGHAFSKVLKGEFAAALPKAAGIAKYLAPLLQGPIRRFVARPEIAGLVRQTGMTGATADTAELVEMIRSLSSCDPRTLFATYEAVSGDPASALLPLISVPALLIAGGFDQFASHEMVHEMAARIPDATLEIFEDATHFLPIEYPERLTRDVARFLESLD